MCQKINFSPIHKKSAILKKEGKEEVKEREGQREREEERESRRVLISINSNSGNVTFKVCHSPPPVRIFSSLFAKEGMEQENRAA